MSGTSGVSGLYLRIVGMDPRAGWLLGPGLQSFPLDTRDDVLIPFIIRVDDAGALAVINDQLLGRPGSFSPLFHAVSFDVDLGTGVSLGQLVSAVAPKRFFDELAGGGTLEPLRVGRKRIQLGTPLPAQAPPARPLPTGIEDAAPPASITAPPDTAAMQPPGRSWPSGTVVIGIIDDGIAFAHERFRRADGSSRVEAFWNQDKPPIFSSNANKLEKQQIDEFIDACTTAGWTDEDKLYRLCGLIDFTKPSHRAVAWRIAHGTHVLDLAAGFDRKEDRADRPIIAVQLPGAATASQSGVLLEPSVLRAMNFILNRARRLTEDGAPLLPVVINFSYGTHAGPHDGTSLLEEEIDKIVANANSRVQVVLPAGNTHGSRCHAEVAFQAPDEIVALRLRVQPDDQTSSAVQLWLPHAGAEGPAQSRVSLFIETPDGVQSGWINEEPNQAFKLSNGEAAPYCTGSYSFMPTPMERGVFQINLQPTTQVRSGSVKEESLSIAPAGVWTITLRNTRLAPSDKIEAWIERDDLLYGHPRRGRQSYFDEPCYLRFDQRGHPVHEDPEQPSCTVKRASMVNAIGTGKQAVVIGGFVRKSLEVACYSAGGPSTPARGDEPDLSLRKPDALMVSDDSRVHFGVLAAGSRSGSVAAMNGTSVAAPQLTRWIADRFAADEPVDRAAVQQFAALKEEELPPAKPPLPPGRGGAGRIEIKGIVPGSRSRYER